MLGTGPEVPIAAKYNPHPITERFNVLTAYSLARSVTANPAGANNRFAQNLVETGAKQLGRDRHQGADDVGPGAAGTDKGDIAGPVSLAAAVSAAVDGAAPAPAAERRRAPSPRRAWS